MSEESRKKDNQVIYWEFGKLLGDENPEIVQFYEECKALYQSSKVLVSALKNILVEMQENFKVENFSSSIDLLVEILARMKKIRTFMMANSTNELENHRISLWKTRLSVEKLAISKIAVDLVIQLLDTPVEETALRLADLYNEIQWVKLAGDFKSINVFSNACPMLLYPLRKLSMGRVLQILAVKRAEMCGFQLMHKLLQNYFDTEGEVFPADDDDDNDNGLKHSEDKTAQNNKLLVSQNSASSNTSVEIYRTLTKHLENKTKEDDRNGESSMGDLWRFEKRRGKALLAVSAKVAPQLLGTNSVVPSKSSGHLKLKNSAKRKFVNHYQEMVWGEVGGYLEHILLWWNPEPLGVFPPPLCQSLRDYIAEMKTKELVPSLLVPSVNSLLDAMCCHLTSTSWDQLFRKTLVSARNVKNDVFKNYEIEGSATGQLFQEMFTDLIKLNNTCDSVYLSIEELPLFEQIPILHRLDHSVHMVRLWSSNRCRNLAAKWNLDEFYCTCHTDITKCLNALNNLKLINHENIPATTSVQVVVCIKMRAKLASEIKENIEKLKKTGSECIEVLAKNCRTESLAILHMIFPSSFYWKQNGPLSDCASDYVEKYLDSVLRPVFVATNKMTPEIQLSSSTMILRILCESWLEYVYLHRIKFSEWGAVQLLTDFGAVPTWLIERVHLSKDLLNALVSHEVLRRCEGVGRLLLRRRGESIKMTVAVLHKRCEKEESSADNMPAEMYVPNQEQWLDLRAPIKTNVCCQL